MAKKMKMKDLRKKIHKLVDKQFDKHKETRRDSSYLEARGQEVLRRILENPNLEIVSEEALVIAVLLYLVEQAAKERQENLDLFRSPYYARSGP